MERAVAATEASAVAEHRFLELPASEPPWVDTGLTVATGDLITVVRHGRASFAGTELWFDAGFNVWARVDGAGPLERGSRATHTFRAPRDGGVELGNGQPTEWSDHDGSYDDDPLVYSLMEGGADVLLIRWTRDAEPAAALRAMTARGSDRWGYLAGEADRLEHGLSAPPTGWEHLWFLGPSEVFTKSGDVLHCRTRSGDAAIVCHPADVVLTEQTMLEWSWRIGALPSRLPEHELQSHDYLSLAVEFDDGQDLTYHWSAALPSGTSYRCPLPHWTARETHLVLGTGLNDIGQWRHESRRLLADQQSAIGGAAPARVTRVWLIAVSLMQRLEGSCDFHNITLRDEVRTLAVL
jgi:hypothetical protein